MFSIKRFCCGRVPRIPRIPRSIYQIGGFREVWHVKSEGNLLALRHRCRCPDQSHEDAHGRQERAHLKGRLGARCGLWMAAFEQFFRRWSLSKWPNHRNFHNFSECCCEMMLNSRFHGLRCLSEHPIHRHLPARSCFSRIGRATRHSWSLPRTTMLLGLEIRSGSTCHD